MNTPENTQKTKNSFHLPPERHVMTALQIVLLLVTGRRSLRNIILIGVLMTSGAIASTLILTAEEEIKVQVESKPKKLSKILVALSLKA